MNVHSERYDYLVLEPGGGGKAEASEASYTARIKINYKLP